MDDPDKESEVTCTVQSWSDERKEALKVCFESLLCEEVCAGYGEDIDSLVTCVMDYIHF